MGIFDEVGKKISQAGQGAISKTKDFADVAKLNSNISDEQNRITSAYTEIGKLYFETHADNFEDCFATQFASIKEAMTKINDYEKQIVDIKGVVKCPRCGAEVSKDAAFCATCGNAIVVEKPVTEAVNSNEKKCPNCGVPISEGAAFCVNCGTKVEEN